MGGDHNPPPLPPAPPTLNTKWGKMEIKIREMARWTARKRGRDEWGDQATHGGSGHQTEENFLIKGKFGF